MNLDSQIFSKKNKKKLDSQIIKLKICERIRQNFQMLTASKVMAAADDFSAARKFYVQGKINTYETLPVCKIEADLRKTDARDFT